MMIQRDSIIDECSPAITDLLARAVEVAAFCAADAAVTDYEGGFPSAAFARIAEAGLLAAPLARAEGGVGLGNERGGMFALLRLLKEIGRGNLAVGRLYEGHINALLLVQTFGTAAQVARYAADARDDHKIFGVWNTEAGDGVRFTPVDGGCYRLSGTKTFASGAGHIQRPLITGALPDGGWQMCIVPTERVVMRVDERGWQPIGMRASASYRIAFDGVVVGPDDLIGAPGDYYREPWFGGGAIRFAAVQLGGAEALFDAMCAFLRDTGRTADPYQTMRAGEGAIAIESGNLWLRGAAAQAETSAFVGEGGDPATMTAYAGLVRTAIEAICLDVIRLVERSVGARGLLRPQPFERIIRDLTMYLRQPAPDAVLAQAGRYALQSTLRSGEMWAYDR